MPSTRFILLTALICILLALLTAAVTGGREKTAKNRPQTIETLKQSSREKALDWKRYENYANAAERDNDTRARDLFKAISLSDSINMAIQQLALKRLGALSPIVLEKQIEIGSTQENLHNALANRERQATFEYPAWIGSALGENARYTARILIWAEGTANKHAQILDRILYRDNPQENQPSQFWVCRTCGNTFSDQDKENYCPYCMTPQTEYIEIGRHNL